MLGIVWSSTLQKLAASNLLVHIAAALCGLLLAWRLWKFSLAPILWPTKPKVLPYWLPFIGHTWEFIRNPERLINNGFHYFGSNHPFALTVAGRTTVILRDVQDVATIWRNTQALSFDPFVDGVLRAFGISGSTLVRIFQDPREVIHGEARNRSLLINKNPQYKGYMNLEREWFKTQLLAPEALGELQQKYSGYLNQSLSWDQLSPTYIKSSTEKSKTVSLKGFSKYTLSYCSTKTFFGRKLEQVAPEFLQNYQDFEEESWKIFYRFPPFLVRRSHRYKNQAIDGLVTYLAVPKEERSELVWLFQTMHREMQYLDIPIRDIAGIFLIIIWAINNNAHKIGFWILAHLLHNPAYMDAVQKEIAAAVSALDAKPDMNVLLTACPHLDAIWYETLRLYNATSAVRQATAPCVVGGKTILVGDQLVAPFRQFHLNREIFGNDSPIFRPERFLQDRMLQRTKGYAPFGGGHTYCPGRLFAQREIYLFIAETLWRFNLALVPRKGGPRVPQVDENTPSAAAMGPDEDVLVQLSLRVHKE